MEDLAARNLYHGGLRGGLPAERGSVRHRRAEPDAAQRDADSRRFASKRRRRHVGQGRQVEHQDDKGQENDNVCRYVTGTNAIKLFLP